MASDLTRRAFLRNAGLAGAATAATASEKPREATAGRVKIIGVACSPRKGKTTAAAVRACLDAAAEAGEDVAVELIELAGLAIDGSLAAGIRLPPGQKDDFPPIAKKLADPNVGGIILGTPVYFSGMSSLCKAFLDRWMAFRRTFPLTDKVAGVLAVGGSRNGGQEVAIRSVQDALFCHDLIVVGSGRPTSRFGAAVWSKGGAIDGDKDGLPYVRNLGRRVATVALALARSGAGT